MKVKVPRTIRIGAYDYTIRYVRELIYAYKLLGQSLADCQLIKIDPGTTISTKDVTLWHEQIHSISEVYGCDLSEANIDRLAQAMVAILKNDYGIEFDWGDIKDA